MKIESIKAKLQNYSKKYGKTHQYTITRFMQERFLYRLSNSIYKKNFLLKGGALVYTYGVEESRFTKDIDFLAKQIETNHDNLSHIFREVASIDVNDGMKFSQESLRVETITKEGAYTGTRIKILGRLGNIKQFLQIDIGVGDYVTPGPQEIEYPTIIAELQSPILNAYSLETLVAEKFEAMISLGEYNTRMKDFYDIYKFVEACDSKVLLEAIKNTFTRRRTTLSMEHPVFSKDFYTDNKRMKQWSLFLGKNEIVPIDFIQVHEKINENLIESYKMIYFLLNNGK